MANSRELVECTAVALGRPLTEVTAHMRHLREANLVTTGGRGITAPRMTYEDAASLICSLYSAELIKDGVASVKALKSLRGKAAGAGDCSNGLLGSAPGQGIVFGLAEALRLLSKERRGARGARSDRLRIAFSLQFPEHYATLIATKSDQVESWAYGVPGRPRTRQIRECDQDGLHEIANCVAAP